MNKKIFVAAAALFALGGVFDIADVANVGWGGGVGLGYLASDKVRLMADFDFGAHGTDTPDVTINTYH
jgi:hypothetical protein